MPSSDTTCIVTSMFLCVVFLPVEIIILCNNENSKVHSRSQGEMKFVTVRIAQLVSAQPSEQEVASSLSLVTKHPCFDLFQICVVSASFKYP